MKERSKGLLILVGSAVFAGVVMEVQRHRNLPDQAPEPTPSGAVSASSAPETRRASAAEVRSALASLEAGVRAPAGDPAVPWALAHGLVAFGADFKATDGRPAVDVIASFAERTTDNDQARWGFPETKGKDLVEPHRHLLTKTLLESNVPLDRSFVVTGAERITLRDLVLGLHKSVELPTSDAQWHHAAWGLSAVALANGAGVTPPPEAVSVDALRSAALTRLEADHEVVTNYTGPIDQAFEPGSPLRDAKANKTGIYGHSCGGLHLTQAVLTAFAGTEGPELARVKRQLGVLIFRYEVERPTLTKLLASHPEQGLLLRVQQLKLYGHLVETITLADQLGYLKEKNEGTEKLRTLALTAAADVADVVQQLDRGGVFQRLPAIRADREQTYLDLVGDGCHAIRGLRRLLPWLE